MAIVKMSEFNLIVMNKDVDALLDDFQNFKDISFAQETKIDVNGFEPVVSQYDFALNRRRQEHIQSVLKSIAEYKKKNEKKPKLLESFSVKQMTYEELIQGVNDSDLDEILDTYAEYYESPYAPVEGYHFHIPWEKESLMKEDILLLQNQSPLIGTVGKEFVEDIKSELKQIKPVYYIHDEKNEDEVIFVIIAPEAYREAVMIVADKYELEKRSAVSLHIQEQVDAMIEVLEENIEKRVSIGERIAKIGHYQDVLQMHYEYLRNEYVKESMRLNFYQSAYTTYIRGWVQTEDESVFEDMVERNTSGVFDLEINPAPLHSIEVPIKLKNNRFNQAFEQITNMYSQPRYDELDPTPLFAPFYAFFFGMMLADFGYGMVMGILAYCALKFINFKPGMHNMIKMLGYVSVTTMIWGLIYGSFFGGMVPLKPIIDINNQFTLVLVMSVGFGVFHLFTGLAIKAYIYIRDYKFRYVLYDVVFWYMALLGVVVLVSQLFSDILAPYSEIALIVMAIGMVGIVLTNGRDAKTAPGKVASGLYSLYGITNYIGDVVSYSRLMALGLAGASIGVAFNMMVEIVQGFGVIGTVFGVLIFIGGHTFNLLISGLSSYVHSARLTYVEFFGKFYVGGGRAFKPFRADPTYINVE